MKQHCFSIVVATVAVGVVGCGGRGNKTGGGNQPSSVHIQLQQQNGSGESGDAVLTASGGETRIVIDLASYAAFAQPAHIHRGTCLNLDPTPAYPLNDVVKGRSTTVVDVPLDMLLTKPFAINVHWSAKNLKKYVACGNIGVNEAPAQTYTSEEGGGG
jgi:hypothetical protein